MRIGKIAILIISLLLLLVAVAPGGLLLRSGIPFFDPDLAGEYGTVLKWDHLTDMWTAQQDSILAGVAVSADDTTRWGATWEAAADESVKVNNLRIWAEADSGNYNTAYTHSQTAQDSSNFAAGALSVTDITNGSNGFSLKTGDAAIVTTGTVATGTWASNITLGANETIYLGIPTALTAGQYIGKTATFTAGYTTAVGDIVYLATTSKLLGADADAAASTKPLLGVALEVKNDTEACLVLLDGFINLAAYAFTDSIGKPVYVSVDVKVPTVVVPASGKFLRVLGQAITDDILRFDPDNIWGQVQ